MVLGEFEKQRAVRRVGDEDKNYLLKRQEGPHCKKWKSQEILKGQNFGIASGKRHSTRTERPGIGGGHPSETNSRDVTYIFAFRP